jgi:tetratricopeptide (TPR) repeat protein
MYSPMPDRPADAEKAARNAISVYVSSGATRSPRLALALDRLGDILLSLQRPAEAEQPLAQAVAIYDALPNPRAKDHAGAEHRLGLAIARAGRRNEALPHLRRSTVLGARYFADDDPLYATYYHNLAVWADAAEDDPGTVEAYTKALGIFGRYQRRTGQTAAAEGPDCILLRGVSAPCGARPSRTSSAACARRAVDSRSASARFVLVREWRQAALSSCSSTRTWRPLIHNGLSSLSSKGHIDSRRPYLSGIRTAS